MAPSTRFLWSPKRLQGECRPIGARDPIMAEQTQIDYRTFSLTQLVAAARDGDHSAFDELHHRFCGKITWVVGQIINDANEVDEVVQDVFIQALRKLDQLSTLEAFGGWINRIAVRMAINRSKRRPQLAFIDQEILEATVQGDQDAESAVIREETRKRLHEKMGLLKARDRETLVAYYFEDQSVNEMSLHFAAPVGTIKRRLHTARQRLAAVCQDLAAC